MSRTSSRSRAASYWAAAAGAALVAAVLLATPPALKRPAEVAVRELLAGLSSAVSRAPEPLGHELNTEPAGSPADADALHQDQTRRLTLRLARANEELARLREMLPFAHAVPPQEPLDLVPVRLLQWGRDAESRPERLMAQPLLGKPLPADGLLVAWKQTRRLPAEDGYLLDGVAILGRVDVAGPNVATIVETTASEFRAAAEILRPGEHSRFVAEGVLEGRGEKTAALKFVSTEIPVEAGDLVVTSRNEPIPGHLVFGVVAKAAAPAGAPFWEITVTPAAQPDRLRSAYLLTPANPDGPAEP